MAASVISSSHPAGMQILCRNALKAAAFQRATIKAILALAGSSMTEPPKAELEPFVLTPARLDPSRIDAATEDYLGKLVSLANAAAESLLCGSVLAGHATEADEYGDVAIALGEGAFGRGHEQNVIDALGLTGLTSDGNTPVPVDLSPSTSIPSTVNVPSEYGAEVGELSALVKQLRESYAFRIEKNTRVVYVYLGHYAQFGWVGLASIGVQT